MNSPVPVETPPEVPAPQTLVCANCHEPLAGDYCTACGQRHEPHVHTVGHFLGEAFESITHADSRLWRTLWYLLAKPGRLTCEFFAGKRVSYLPPFRLYLVISVVFFVVATLPGRVANSGAVLEIDDSPSAERIAGMERAAQALEQELAATPGSGTAAQALRERVAHEQALLDGEAPPQVEPKGLQNVDGFAEFCKSFEKEDPEANYNYARLHAMCVRSSEDNGKALFENIVHNIPRAMFVFLPLVALFMRLMYWRPKRYYVEHLLLLVHNHAFVFLLLTLLGLLEFIPVVGEHLGLPKTAAWTYMFWYIFRAMRVYYGQTKGLTVLKYLAIGLVYLCTSVTVLLLTAMYSAFTM